MEYNFDLEAASANISHRFYFHGQSTSKPTGSYKRPWCKLLDYLLRVRVITEKHKNIFAYNCYYLLWLGTRTRIIACYFMLGGFWKNKVVIRNVDYIY